ncbi:MAG: branched-chain amino acid ABC transporter permease [Geminicoccaceae bacterium]
MSLLQALIDAVSLGAVYALAALGVGLIFGIMRLVNFAHGELIMSAGYTLYALSGQPTWLRIVSALVVAVLVALLLERGVFRTLRGANPATLLIASFAVSYLVQNIALMIFGGRPTGVDFMSDLGSSMDLAGASIPLLQVATLALTTLLLGALMLFFRLAPIGVQMRAAAEDFAMARLVGVDANRVIAIAFAISGVLAAAVAFYVVAQSGSVGTKMGVNMVLVAFVACVIGGIGSLPGAALGGFVLGIVSVGLQSFLPVDLRPYRDAFIFLIFIAFLLWRPNGLLLRQSDLDRV